MKTILEEIKQTNQHIGWCIKFATGLNIIIRHSSKSIIVIKLSFCQNDPPMGESFWQNNSLVTHILFELCLLCMMWPKQFWSVQNGFGLTKPPFSWSIFIRTVVDHMICYNLNWPKIKLWVHYFVSSCALDHILKS